MQHQRKRFSYLTVQQRALNTSNVIDTDKTASSRHGSIVIGSNNKSYRKEQPTTTQQHYTSFNRNSSAKKVVEPLAELCQNHIFAEIKTSANKSSIISNKQNLLQRPSLKTDEKPSYTHTSRPLINPNLQSRIKQLEQQNTLILKQTQDKFILMEQHLEKVQGILKEKEMTIESLANQNMELKDKCKSFEEVNGKLVDQKEELLRIINEKNEEIKRLMGQKQSISLKQTELPSQFNTYTLQSKKLTLESANPKQSVQTLKTTLSSTQTTLTSSDIDSLIVKSNQLQQTDKLNYRQKYEALFKRALQMEDEMYKLKQDLFDSQNEVKTIQQEFNTFKIFNQIEKINMQN